MKRREFLKLAGAGLVAPLVFSKNLFSSANSRRKVLVLGFDGMDPNRVMRMVKEGKLPNIKRFLQRGYLSKMVTTPPPQSPVAWGSFITGKDPGGYGIYDFIHRDPKTYLPKFSQSDTIPASHFVKLGSWRIPLKGGKVVLNRGGKAFWNYLEEADIDSTVFKVPSNYPPEESKARTLAGMGTPDLLGTYGTYFLYTSDEKEAQADLPGARVYYAYFNDYDEMETEIEGPQNPLKEEEEPLTIPFKVYLDRSSRAVRIDIQGSEILLKEGELSPWVELKFEVVAGIQHITAMVRFLLLSAGEKFRLYVSPLCIDPKDPALPLSTPENYSKELAEKLGLFHTLGLPADTKALSNLTFTVGDFITQSMSILEESNRIYHYELDRFLSLKKGFLFFYYSSLDQGQHMFWALSDPEHPYYHPEESRQYGNMIEELYMEFDKVVGYTLKKLPPDVPFMVISDHGFAPFRRGVNINKWLIDHGYLKPAVSDYAEANIVEVADWGQSVAYSIGLNGLYINLKGREGEGIVSPSEKRALMEEIKAKLLALRDPKTGQPPITAVFISEDIFSKDYLDRAPDLIIGFNRGYRMDNSSAIGGITKEAVHDNLDWWSGDHCIDPSHVLATFMSNFKIARMPHMWDVPATILKLFGVETPPDFKGKPLI